MKKIITEIASEILENRFITSSELVNNTSVNKEQINYKWCTLIKKQP